MKYLPVIFVLGLFLVILLSGCVTQNNNKDQNISEDSNIKTPENSTFTTMPDTIIEDSVFNNTPPSWITNLVAYSSEDSGEKEIVFYFSLLDNSKKEMTYSGTAEVSILDDTKNKVFKNTFQVNADDFWNAEIGIAKLKKLIWTGYIPVNEINKGFSSSGTLKLVFNTSDGLAGFDEISTEVYGLPELNEEELTSIYDSKFDKVATTLNNTKIIKNHLKMTLSKIGLIDIFEYDKTKTYLRMDLIVENIDNKTISNYPNPVLLTKNSQQFESVSMSSIYYKNTLDSGEISSGVIKKGAIFFELPSNFNLSDLKELIINTDITDYDVEYEGVHKGDSVKDGYNYVFKFDLSNVSLK